jgi:hypothetical protein
LTIPTCLAQRERIIEGMGKAGVEAPKLEPWIVRYELSDFERAAIKPFLPPLLTSIPKIKPLRLYDFCRPH